MNLRRSPPIVRRLLVAQVISVNRSSDAIVGNVPDELAAEIPRVLLLLFSNNSNVIASINRKQWSREQAALIFDFMVTPFAINVVGGVNNLSSFLLQGFTCTGVRNSDPELIRALVKASRREAGRKVTLVETQLTCMYNHIRQPNATDFTCYPPDLLLYYEYPMVAPSSCRAYFQELGRANFFVVSPTLAFILTDLIDNARACLGITSTSLTRDNVVVLGNMSCVLNATYIQNSDPFILEILKNCPDLTEAQAAAVFAQLQSGNTQFGDPSTWTEATLRGLGLLPLYLNSTFYRYFDTQTKQSFLRSFLEVLEDNGVDRQRRGRLRREIRRSIQTMSKRSTACTVGVITRVTINNATFPIQYLDVNQFSSCLSAATVKNNLNALTAMVDDRGYQEAILARLREAYPNSSIPEAQVQLLMATSRAASDADIKSWNITQIDTLAALFDAADGPWTQSGTRNIVSVYLGHQGNELGANELSAIGGTALCFLDIAVLRGISPQSLIDADLLSVDECSPDKQILLFDMANSAIASNTRAGSISSSDYQLLLPFIGGAGSDFVRRLSASDIDMEGGTLIRFNRNVLLALSVQEVAGLLGPNVRDLLLYQNHPAVSEWISSQFQSDLTSLGIGLTGGRSDPTTPATSPATSPTSPMTPASTGTTTPSGGDSVHVHPGFIILALLLTFQLFLA